ncbi:MAG: NlpC/P60 family protein, partial [Nocardioidaceae bacterium]
ENRPIVTDGRKRITRAHIIRLLATLCLTALGGSVLAASPSSAKPDVDSVQTRVDRLYQQAEQASERYNQARLDMRRARTRLTALQSDLQRQQLKVDSARQQAATAVVSQYQGQALSSTAQVLLADNPDSFLDQLTTVAAYNAQQSQMMVDFSVQAKRLDMRRSAASRELARIVSTKEQLGAEKKQVDAKAAEAKKLLTTLKDRAAARASRSGDRVAATPTSAPASGRAAAAVRYALAQVGDAYVYGAAGPSAFDCSGLTMMAWQQAGVSLPHSSSAQMGSGTPVSQSALQPGDLVFYYSPVSHVGMYIGNGQIVNAENPSVGVKITGVNSMPYAGAVRPG